MQEKDFKNQRLFPGTTGNPFDIVLHQIVSIQKIPAFIYGLILFLIAFIVFQTRWYWTAGLFLFFLLDWILLASLPRAGKSFGPCKPTVLILAVLRSLAALLPWFISIPLEIFGTILVIYGFWVEPHRIKVTHHVFNSPKLAPGQSFTLLHLGDLHVERITARERQLSVLINQLKPDLIVFSGDFLNLSFLHDPQAMEDTRCIIRDWKAPYGVFVVTGSPAVDLDDVVPALLEGLPVHWLRDQKVGIKIKDAEFNLIGVNCSHKPFIDGPKLDALCADTGEKLHILLYHSPDLAPIAARNGIDLQLSGHTHGGQVRLPGIGALFTGSLYGKLFEAGRMSIGQMTLYITRGIGLEGAGAPRVRFLCPPEIILWEIANPAES